MHIITYIWWMIYIRHICIYIFILYNTFICLWCIYSCIYICRFVHVLGAWNTQKMVHCNGAANMIGQLVYLVCICFFVHGLLMCVSVTVCAHVFKRLRVFLSSCIDGIYWFDISHPYVFAHVYDVLICSVFSHPSKIETESQKDVFFCGVLRHVNFTLVEYRHRWARIR